MPGLRREAYTLMESLCQVWESRYFMPAQCFPLGTEFTDRLSGFVFDARVLEQLI